MSTVDKLERQNGRTFLMIDNCTLGNEISIRPEATFIDL